MKKGFYSLNAACARSTTYWDTEDTTPQWEALGWKKEIDCSFSRAVTSACKLNTQRKVSEPQVVSGFSLFDEDDCKRSQNCAITGRRVVSMLSFDKSMGATDVIADLIDGLRDGGENGDCPTVLLYLFSNTFEVNGVHDKRAEDRFRYLQQQDQEEVRVNMKTHEYLAYQLRIEHETRNVRWQLQSIKNAHSVLCSEAPVHVAEARRIHAALEHTTHRRVRNVVGAMREMAAYYLHGNTKHCKDEYVPDIVQFSVSLQEKNDAFSGIFLTYYKMPGTDAEFEDFITDCCRIFGAVGKVDWSERDLARETFNACVLTTSDTCTAFATASELWQAFGDTELPKMREVALDVETLDNEARSLMCSVAASLGVAEGKSGELIAAFESIFLSLSRSMKLVTVRRRELQVELHALRHSAETGREEVARLLTTEVAEQYDVWSFLCDTMYFKVLRRAIRALICPSQVD